MSDFEISATLVIRGFRCDPQVVTKTLGIVPTDTWLTGESVRPNADKKHRENAWIKRINGTHQNASFEAILTAFEKQLQPIKDKLRLLPQPHSISLYVAILPLNYMPSVVLKKNHVTMLSEIGANFELVVYTDTDCTSKVCTRTVIA